MPTVSPAEKSKKYPNLNTGLYGKLALALTRFLLNKRFERCFFSSEGKGEIARLASRDFKDDRFAHKKGK